VFVPCFSAPFSFFYSFFLILNAPCPPPPPPPLLFCCLVIAFASYYLVLCVLVGIACEISCAGRGAWSLEQRSSSNQAKVSFFFICFEICFVFFHVSIMSFFGR